MKTRKVTIELAVIGKGHRFDQEAFVAFAEEENLAVLIRQTLGDSERERRAIEGELGEYADGTILSPVSSDLSTIIARRSKTPLVLVGAMA